ncbi:MAG TPA: FHA domain-containing protein, partial [Gemmatimonadaceae bacterium]|nr:FHA domain-containing protein [Gemmatimonadaceae bacterium]
PAPPPSMPQVGTPQRGTPQPAAPAPAAPVVPPAPRTVPTPAPAAATPAPPAAVRPPLAVLEIMNEGVLKGRRFEIRQPLVHVGRGAHNDIPVADESVSDSHAKIQKRESGWFVVDMGSTNGTYVAGRRVDEAALAGQTDVRFGGIKMAFRPVADAPDDVKGTRAIAGAAVEQARRIAAEQRAAAAAARPAEPEPKSGGVPAIVYVLVLLLLGLGAFFVLQGR